MNLRANSDEIRRPIVIGVAGGTGSGKTTLATALQTELGEHVAVTVSQDSYYKDLAHLDFAERARANFDHPDSLDFTLMTSHVGTLKECNDVTLPLYDFAHHVRLATGRPVHSRPVVIIEGILVLVWKPLRDLMDITVFVDAPEKVRLNRRLKRDVAERGRDVQSVLDQYYATVRPMHQTFVEPSANNAELTIDGEGNIRHSVGTVLDRLHAAAASHSSQGTLLRHTPSPQTVDPCVAGC